MARSADFTGGVDGLLEVLPDVKERRVGRRMSADDTGRIQVESLLEFRQGRVSQSVRTPFLDTGLNRRPFDGLAVTVDAVSQAGFGHRLGDRPVQLARLHFGFAFLPQFAESFRITVSRRKDVFVVGLAFEIRQQNFLATRADGNQSPFVVVLGFVGSRLEYPDIAISVKITGPHLHDLVRSAAAESLDPYHVGDNGRKAR